MTGPRILDGRTLRDAGILKLKSAIGLRAVVPTLVIVQVGNLSESNAYIEQKKKFGEKIGATVIHQKFPDTVGEEELVRAIMGFNQSGDVHGIIVQLPIPSGLTKQTIIDTIDPRKDVDGLTTSNKNLFEAGDRRAVVPATARGVLSLLRGYGIGTVGKKVTVVGRSALVGSPIATLLIREGATVTVCHRSTSDIPEKCRNADILVIAVGSPRLITKDYVSVGQTVVDVGINSVDGEKLDEELPKKILVGDVDFETVKGIVGAISPVPGGVGPMTVLSLYENLCEASGINF